jgi:hypothetical protein
MTFNPKEHSCPRPHKGPRDALGWPVRWKGSATTSKTAYHCVGSLYSVDGDEIHTVNWRYKAMGGDVIHRCAVCGRGLDRFEMGIAPGYTVPLPRSTRVVCEFDRCQTTTRARFGEHVKRTAP